MNDRIDLAIEYAACAEQVRAFRARYSAHWPTPSPEDCLRYAVTEAAEAMSDWLREQHPYHQRNHARQPDVVGELGDCLIMLITYWALDRGWDDKGPFQSFYKGYPFKLSSLDVIVHKCISALLSDDLSSMLFVTYAVEGAINGIIDRGRSPREVVAERLAGIKAKHVPAEPPITPELPDEIRDAASRIIAMHLDDWPEDEWIAIEDKWDLNLWLNGDRRKATVYTVRDGATDTSFFYPIPLEDGQR